MFVCDVHTCDMRFSRFEELTDHRRLHAGNTVLMEGDMQWRGEQTFREALAPGRMARDSVQ